MEKTDRELLIKEISSRLPYGIKVQVFGWDEEKGEVAVPLKVYSINTDGYISLEYNHYDVESVYIEDCLLYLRPMSSMTEEEIIELNNIPSTKNYTIIKDDLPWDVANYKQIDWLNAHHLDFRNLIERGFAIAITEENNPYKK